MSIFLDPRYRQQLTYTTQTPTPDERNAVVNELFTKVKFKTHVENIDCKVLKGGKGIRIHPLHTETIMEQLYKIASTGPGMELLQRLNKALANAPPLNISNKKTDGYLNYIKKEIIYDPNQLSYYLSRNSAGEIILVRKPPEVALAHECIHALHLYEDRIEFAKRFEARSPMANMPNAEEFLTIAGFGSRTLKIVDRVCENSILIAFGLPPRISYTGIVGHYTFEQLMSLNAIGTVKEIMATHPSFVTTQFGSRYPYQLAEWLGNTQMAELLKPLPK